MNKIFSKICQFFRNTFSSTLDRNRRGIEWVGKDGLITMETSALLVIFFMIFFQPLFAMAISFLLVLGKCLLDKKRGSEHEKHDFICSLIGVVGGVILGAANLSLVLF